MWNMEEQKHAYLHVMHDYCLFFQKLLFFILRRKKTIIDNRASVSITGTKIIKIGFLETKR